MPSLLTTSVCAGIFSVMMVILSFQISLRRVKLGGIDFGDGNDLTLRRRIRAHGNFVEYAPFALICVGLLEYREAPSYLVIGIAIGFVLARVLHAVGMLFGTGPTLRAIAMMVQHLSFLAVAASLVYVYT